MDFINELFDKLLQGIDNGKYLIIPFKWLYMLHAIIGFILPAGYAYFLYKLFDEDMFKYYMGDATWTKLVGFVFLFVFLAFLILIAYLVYLFWADRCQKIDNEVHVGDKIVAVPLFANYFQCVGDCYGVLIGIVPPMGAMLLYLFFALTGEMYFYSDGNFAKVFLAWVAFTLGCAFIGYIVVLISHFTSERIKLYAQIANDVRDLGDIHRAATMH